MAASRLDWIALAQATALSISSVLYFYPSRPTLWSLFERYGTNLPFTLMLVASVVALLWLCWTRNWRQIMPEESLPGVPVVPEEGVPVVPVESTTVVLVEGVPDASEEGVPVVPDEDAPAVSEEGV